ncbi:hypothetical protein KSS87_004241 [Heliosperma pusillum]|nr:hypothetical protein KSS87_004241 [Heliosperma pusillum]
MGGKDGAVTTTTWRPEVDTRAPFRSVKEAVSLFGERVLAGELYAAKLHQVDNDTNNRHETSNMNLGNMTLSELEETKQTLEKAKEETTAMANCLSSLKEELEKTKRELHELKLERESEKQMMEFDMEDVKYVEDPPRSEPRLHQRDQHEGFASETLDFQKKRYVTFANATFSEVIMPEKSGPFLERHPSLKKKPKKPLIPLIGGLFSKKKKKSSEVNGMENDTSKLTFTHANDLLASSSLLQSLPRIPRKRGRKPKAKHANPDPSTSDNDCPMAPAVCRYESSLGLLTKKFVELMHQSEDGMVDLNTIAITLQVRKRRLYDITNVLEGIGMIEKSSKSVMQWRGIDSVTDELACQASSLQDELENLKSVEARIDECIREKQQLMESLSGDSSNKKHLFLSASDIMTLPNLKGKTVFAIKAPRGSYFEVPDPEKDLCSSEKHCSIIVRSSMGPIDVHFLSKTEGNSTNFASTSGSTCGGAESERAASDHFQEVPHVVRSISAEQDKYQIHTITPSDFYSDRPEEDYWLKSGIDVSLTDLWAS